MGPSIEDLKASAASRMNSLHSPSMSMSASSASFHQSSAPLNLPRDSARNRINLSSSAPLADSRFVASAATPSNPLITTPQENLRVTAQTINGLIQKDKIQPDLAELLNGQFSREYTYGDEQLPIVQFDKTSLIPEILLNQVRQNNGNTCFMGMFPEIRRAWLTSGNCLYLWSFENNRDFTQYLNCQYEIIDVALVRPKADVFNSSVEWVLVIVTPMEIILLAVVFKSPDQLHVKENTVDYTNLDLVLVETGLVFPSDEVNMVSVCGTKDGRIFAAGSDGNIYEFVYQDSSNWFSSKCKKINRTSSALSYIVPTFLRSIPSRACVVKLTYDPSRNIIYGLTEQSTIHLYWLGQNEQDFEFVGVTGDLSSEAMKLTPTGIISSSKALDIVSIHPVDFAESEVISLVAICRSGIRMYFSNITSMQQHQHQSNMYAQVNQQNRLSQAPRGIRLAHLRAPPEENRVRDPKKLVHRWSPSIHCAFHSNGVTLAANTISNEGDLVLGMIINPSVGSASSAYRLPLEYSVEIEIEGKVSAIDELSASEIKGTGRESAFSHSSPLRSFAILTNVGVYIYSKLRPVDQLSRMLSEQNLPWPQLEKFFKAYGYDQACAFCIALCCRSPSDARWNASDNVLTFRTNAISVLLKYGGLNLIESHPDHRNSMFSNHNQLDGIGRIIATQPEFENSPMHEGFYIYFSRLVFTIWKRSMWDFQSIPDHLMLDLVKFYQFISENLVSFTEKRYPILDSGNEEAFQRRQNAVEFENESLLRLKETAGLLIELLTFISICTEDKLLDSLKSEPIATQNTGMNIEMLLTSSKGKSLIKELGNMLVVRQLRTHSQIKPLIDSLRSRCSSFFSEEDAFLQEGREALERVRLCRNQMERIGNVIEALEALKKACKVLSVANLFEILDQFDSLGFIDSSLLLGLHYIAVMDPENIGLRTEFNQNIQLSSDEHEICRQRELIYDRLMESISCASFDDKKTTALLNANSSMDIKALKQKVLQVATSSRDELFHYRFYEWLVKPPGYSQVLLELPETGFLYKYLRSTFLARNDLHRDLLWKWLARSGRFLEAASVLASIAESRDYPLSLSKRIEYLSLAITHCKSSTIVGVKENLRSAGFDEIPSIELSELEELLEVAHAQYEVLKEARSVLGGRNEIVCAELDGAVGLLTVSDLFNRYARPYALTESCLKLIHISGLVNERLVSQLWQDIISRHVNEAANDRSAFHQLGSKISELSRKLYPSPSAFPLAHLIDVLGRLTLSSGIEANWLVSVFINSGIPLTALADEFQRFFTSPPSKSWLNATFRTYLLQMIAVLFNIWIKDHSRVSANNPMVVSRIKSYTIAAEELQSSDLVYEFGALLKQLASF